MALVFLILFFYTVSLCRTTAKAFKRPLGLVVVATQSKDDGALARILEAVLGGPNAVDRGKRRPSYDP